MGRLSVLRLGWWFVISDGCRCKLAHELVLEDEAVNISVDVRYVHKTRPEGNDKKNDMRSLVDIRIHRGSLAT